jgi:hypothetical protein
MSLRVHLVAAAACTVLVSLFVAPSGDTAGNIPDPIAGLAGRWSGQGMVIPARGAQENLKCVVTYVESHNGAQVKQNVRCQSASYELDTTTHLLVKGNQVTGRWADKVYSLGGSVSGTLTSDGFDVLLRGQFFIAKMTISTSRCEQSVTVSPARADYIRQISASLKQLDRPTCRYLQQSEAPKAGAEADRSIHADARPPASDR